MIKPYLRNVSFLFSKIKKDFLMFSFEIFVNKFKKGIDLPFYEKNRWFLLLKFIKKAVKYLPFQSREFFRWKKPR